jgi:hypothetical protein
MLTGSGVSFTSMGSLFFLFDYDLQMRVSVLPASEFGDTDLAKYNVVILPSAWGGSDSYHRIFGRSGLDKLRSWVEAGGTLIGVRAGAAFLADSASGMSRVVLRRQALEKYPLAIWGLDLESAESIGLFQATGISTVDESGAPEAEPEDEPLEGGVGIPGSGSPVLGPGAVPFAGEAGGAGAWCPPAAIAPELSSEEWQRVDRRFRRFHPRGVFARADLEQDDWLTAGLPAKLPVYISGDYAYMATSPVRTVARFAAPESLHIGGLLWPEAAARISLTACVTRERKGRGQVILLAMDPFFRGYTHSTKRLLLNAAILGPGLGTQRTTPW